MHYCEKNNGKVLLKCVFILQYCLIFTFQHTIFTNATDTIKQNSLQRGVHFNKTKSFHGVIKRVIYKNADDTNRN